MGRLEGVYISFFDSVIVLEPWPGAELADIIVPLGSDQKLGIERPQDKALKARLKDEVSLEGLTWVVIPSPEFLYVRFLVDQWYP